MASFVLSKNKAKFFILYPIQMILRDFIAEIFQRNKPRIVRLAKAKQAFSRRSLWGKDQIEKPAKSFELGIDWSYKNRPLNFLQDLPYSNIIIVKIAVSSLTLNILNEQL